MSEAVRGIFHLEKNDREGGALCDGAQQNTGEIHRWHARTLTLMLRVKIDYTPDGFSDALDDLVCFSDGKAEGEAFSVLAAVQGSTTLHEHRVRD